MATAVQQLSAECTAIFTMCVVYHIYTTPLVEIPQKYEPMAPQWQPKPKWKNTKVLAKLVGLIVIQICSEAKAKKCRVSDSIKIW